MTKVLVLIFLSLKLFPLEITLTNREQETRNFVAGDLLHVTLKVYPKHAIQDIDDFLKFLEKKELGPFSIIDKKERLPKHSPSDNAFSVDLDLVLRDEVQDESALFYLHRDNKIPILLKGFKYQFVGFHPNINILDLKMAEKSDLYLWAGILLFIVIMAVSFVLFKRYKKNKEQRKRDEENQKILKLFKNLDNRGQLELLYKKREIWDAYVEKGLSESFFSIINRCQYKKDWSEQDFDDVYQAAKKLEVTVDG